MVHFLKTKPNTLQNDNKILEMIISALSQGCRDRSKSVSILSIGLMFGLLDTFSNVKNNYAPVIYKALTFILVEVYQNVDLRFEILHNFTSLFRNYPNIPI